MPPQTITFQEALGRSVDSKRHLLIGNGFSISLFPDRFRYGSLLDEANFDDCLEAREAFNLLNTTDFEVVIKALRDAVALVPLYAGNNDVSDRMSLHSETLKELLVRAIALRHPERPSDISEEQYRACRSFLSNFVGDSRDHREEDGRDLRGRIYTLNYDLLLYWTLLHDQVIDWNAANPLASQLDLTEALQHDDGFRAPEDDPGAPYVTWEAEGAADAQNIHFLHGGLHLFDYGAELQKKCWERAGGVPLIDQVRAALTGNKFPLFVAEGDSESKLTRIRHSGYLQRSLKSFAGVCRSPGAGTSLFVFGHSLASSDDHVLKFIEKGRLSNLFISLYGDVDSAENRQIAQRADILASARPDRYALSIEFFNAESASVWG